MADRNKKPKMRTRAYWWQS